MPSYRWAWAASCAALTTGCHVSREDRPVDREWGQGFSTRLLDAGNPDAPVSATQACNQFGGAPYVYTSVGDLMAHLAGRWVACGDSSGPETWSFWPPGFAGVDLGAGGTWRTLLRAADGTLQDDTDPEAQGTFAIVDLSSDSWVGQPLFALRFLTSADPDAAGPAQQWEGWLEESPDILFVHGNGGDTYRLSSATP
jgi:hypothetical protein